jgi:3'-phosphoadenosine 5'-phosphosulfate (PAPS) 3'-phosphatase
MLAALEGAHAAGCIQMDFYRLSSLDQSCLDVILKHDQSPVTAADSAVHDYLTGFIKKLTPRIPVISEENKKHPAIPRNGLFWCIDPLDGTKEFLARTDAFTVNITLMDKFEPILGIVHNPALGATFFSHHDHPAWKRGSDGIVKEIAPRKAGPSLTTLFNSKHGKLPVYEAGRAYLKGSGLDLPETPFGEPSLPRGLQVAQGSADIFADFGHEISFRGGNGYSWDYGPLDLILRNAGGMIFQIADGKPLSYRKPTQRMNAMISVGDKELGKKVAAWCENRCQ